MNSHRFAPALLLLSGLAAAQRIDLPASLDSLKLAREIRLPGDTHHIQGIETDGDLIWVTSVDRPSKKGFLFEFRAVDGRLVRSVELQDGDRYHPGGISADGDSLWIPVAEYRASSTARIEKRSKRTLAVESSFLVNDHIGCVALAGDLLIGGNWDSRDFYTWNRKGELIAKTASATGNAYQDIKYRSGELIAAGLLQSDRSGAVDRLAVPGFKVVQRMRVGSTPRGASYTREGMTVFGDALWLMPEDGPETRVYVFPLSRRP